MTTNFGLNYAKKKLYKLSVVESQSGQEQNAREVVTKKKLKLGKL